MSSTTRPQPNLLAKSYQEAPRDFFTQMRLSRLSPSISYWPRKARTLQKRSQCRLRHDVALPLCVLKCLGPTRTGTRTCWMRMRRVLYIAASRIKAASLSSSAFRRSSNTSRPSIPAKHGPAQLKNATRSSCPLAIGTVTWGSVTQILNITNVQQGDAMRCSLTIWKCNLISNRSILTCGLFLANTRIVRLCANPSMRSTCIRDLNISSWSFLPNGRLLKNANVKLGIKQHVKAVHEGIGFPCHEEGCAKILSSPSNLASAAQDFAKITSLHGATQTLLKKTSRNFKNYESMSLRVCKSSGPMNLPWGKSLRS